MVLDGSRRFKRGFWRVLQRTWGILLLLLLEEQRLDLLAMGQTACLALEPAGPSPGSLHLEQLQNPGDQNTLLEGTGRL